MSKSKKLASVSATSPTMTGTERKDMITLDKISFIHYPVPFQKRGKEVIIALIDFGNKVKSINSTYTKKLDLQIE